jgi:hypothetical protein
LKILQIKHVMLVTIVAKHVQLVMHKTIALRAPQALIEMIYHSQIIPVLVTLDFTTVE